jgi:hypothetical protein
LQNGKFWGIFTFALKKHRDNYNLNSKKSNNIHIDGQFYPKRGRLFNGDINWTRFEIRNPKNLVYATA